MTVTRVGGWRAGKKAWRIVKDFLKRMVVGGSVSAKDLAEAESSTYVQLDGDKNSYASYFWSLVISAIIATAGIAANSSAVVVGAMLISPIMSPIAGTIIAALRGNKRATARTLVMTLVAIVVGVVVSLVVAVFIPVPIDLSTNPQVNTRTAPGLIDLVVALASGIIAAIALVREDIPAAIPGVAIAVSLMPPLSVVGIALYAGSLDAAGGAFLLFLTNYFAIQLGVLVVFLVLGLGKKEHTELGAESRVAWYAAVVTGFIIISIPLALTSMDIVKENDAQRKAHDVAVQWLADSDYELKDVKIDGKDLTVTIAGTGEEPSLASYQHDLDAEGVDLEDIGVIVLEERHVHAD